MKQKFSWALLFAAVFAGAAGAQDLTQTLRGAVVDADNKWPLAGAQVVLSGTATKMGTVTDKDGHFRIEKVPIGRISLSLSYMGYENLIASNIVVNSGKEVVLNLEMRENAAALSEVIVTASQNKGEALHEMAVLSARSVSPEETNRYAGGFNDPSRILSNFAGITSTQDGSNDLIVRGNSPKYVQWRVEGEQITNPNHFGDQSAVGGSVSILNNNLLAPSDFYTGAFAPEFGDALSGVYDVRLRTGNNEHLEAVFGFGLLGTELTLEGPFKRNYGGSFLVNYRYSTATLISQLGLVNSLNGVLRFQDMTFKLALPTKHAGTFSVFGLGGMSGFEFEDVTPKIWVTPGNNATLAQTRNDFDKKAHLLNLGIKHGIHLGQNGRLTTSLTWSEEGIEDDLYEAGVVRFFDDAGVEIRDSVISKKLYFQTRLRKPVYRSSVTYHHKINARHKIQIGSKFTLFNFHFDQSRLEGPNGNRFILLDIAHDAGTMRNFISWKFRAGNQLTIVSGLHNMNVLLNKKSTLEPRVGVEVQVAPAWKLLAGYGRHSTMESIHHYFARVKQADGSVTEPNRDLDLLKADHTVCGLEWRLGKNLRAKAEFYYQRLFNLPVENADTSYFSTVVEGLDVRYVDLINRGKGKNYGVEVTLEKFFSQQYYFLVNASVFKSTYTPLDGVERNTPYAGDYLVNVLCGREFPGMGKRKNQTLGLNARVFFGGARKIVPLLRDGQGNLAVDPANSRYWDYRKAYTSGLDDPYQIQVSGSYKWNKRRATHELFLNLENVTNHKGRITEFYDETEPGKISYATQFGFFPNMMYRVYF